MPKKKRAVHARGAAAAPSGAAPSSAVSLASFAPSLTGNRDLVAEKQRARRAIHEAKSVLAEIKAETAGLAPLQLERALWMHSAVAGATEIALVLDDVTAQSMFFAAFPMVWAARTCIARWSWNVENPIMIVAGKRRLARVDPVRMLVAGRVFIACMGAIALLVATVIYWEELPLVQWAGIVVFVSLLEVLQLRSMIRADGYQTVAAVVAATIEAFFMVHFFATYMTDTSNLIVDHLARKLTAVTAATHTFVILGAIYVLEHATAHHTAEFQHDRRESAALMAKLREFYRDNEDCDAANKESEAASKRRKKTAKAKLAAAASADAVAAESTDDSLPASPSSFRRPSVQLGLLLALQTLLLVTLLTLVSTVVLAWESMSVLALSSSHVTWTLLRLKQCASVSL